MGATVTTAATLANTKAGRKFVIGFIVALVLAVGFLMTPLIAIPFALVGSSATVGLSDTGGARSVSGEWNFPLEGDYFKGRGFGYNPVTGCSFCSTNHKGYDMAQGCGATVHAAGAGTVVTAGSSGGLGNAVRIDHGDGVETVYGHMQWNSLLVTAGQTVIAGTALGAEGNTGASFGCHLHFEVRKFGTPIPPEQFMADRGLPLK